MVGVLHVRRRERRQGRRAGVREGDDVTDRGRDRAGIDPKSMAETSTVPVVVVSERQTLRRTRPWTARSRRWTAVIRCSMSSQRGRRLR
jgi:hypothetical protein